MLCPECKEPMSEAGMCQECGCYFEKYEFIVTAFYNYSVRPQRSHNRLNRLKEVRGKCQGRGGKAIPPAILLQIRCALPVFTQATALDVKKAMRKLRLTKYVREFIIAATGEEPS